MKIVVMCVHFFVYLRYCLGCFVCGRYSVTWIGIVAIDEKKINVRRVLTCYFFFFVNTEGTRFCLLSLYKFHLASVSVAYS